MKEPAKKLGSKSSRRRDAVLEAFTSSSGHLTVDDLFERARRIDPRIGYTTVWRVLKLLEQSGLADSKKFHDGFTRYEFVGGKKHHDHLICVKCGALSEFMNPKIEEIQKQVAYTHGFSITSHKLELYGYCKKCKHKNNPRR